MSTENRPGAHCWTVDEYRRMAQVGLFAPDDRNELIEGEIVDMAPIGSRHAAAVTALGKRLVLALGDAADVRVQAPLRLGRWSEPQPDIAIVKSRPDAYRDAHPAANDVLLIIEVADSTFQVDNETKARLYAAHGIAEYWIVDLGARVVHVCRNPQGDRYSGVTAITDGPAVIASLDLTVQLDGVF